MLAVQKGMARGSSCLFSPLSSTCNTTATVWLWTGQTIRRTKTRSWLTGQEKPSLLPALGIVDNVEPGVQEEGCGRGTTKGQPRWWWGWAHNP